MILVNHCVWGLSRPKTIDFVHFDTCQSPIFVLSKIRLLVSQLLKLLFSEHFCEGHTTRYRGNCIFENSNFLHLDRSFSGMYTSIMVLQTDMEVIFYLTGFFCPSMLRILAKSAKMMLFANLIFIVD